jgi:mono/diheme cytochrome c family protein
MRDIALAMNLKTGLRQNVICRYINVAFVRCLTVVSLIFVVLSINSAFAESTARTDTSRGAMLYDNHCIQCHTQQLYWQDKRLVIDKKSLTDQVNRWQRNAGLEWSDDDIKEVSQYLNGKFYHYP